MVPPAAAAPVAWAAAYEPVQKHKVFPGTPWWLEYNVHEIKLCESLSKTIWITHDNMTAPVCTSRLYVNDLQFTRELKKGIPWLSTISRESRWRWAPDVCVETINVIKPWFHLKAVVKFYWNISKSASLHNSCVTKTIKNLSLANRTVLIKTHLCSTNYFRLHTFSVYFFSLFYYIIVQYLNMQARDKQAYIRMIFQFSTRKSSILRRNHIGVFNCGRLYETLLFFVTNRPHLQWALLPEVTRKCLRVTRNLIACRYAEGHLVNYQCRLYVWLGLLLPSGGQN